MQTTMMLAGSTADCERLEDARIPLCFVPNVVYDFNGSRAGFWRGKYTGQWQNRRQLTII